MARLPLYQEAVEALKSINKDPDKLHAGLWYDKFCNQWNDHWSISAEKQNNGEKEKKSEVPPKLKWIRTLTSKSNDSIQECKVGSTAFIAEYLERQQWLTQEHGGRTLRFKADGPFVSGLGREHPMENGFTWHPTLGTPYLPGSSVKGLVRAWAEAWEEKIDQATATRLFGPHGAEAQRDPHAGSVIFLDALPQKPVQLKAEVMTPHYKPWHECSTEKITLEKAPGDWHSPVPIQYLAVSGRDFLLQFGILPRTAADAADVDLVVGLLKDALANIGAGAKTSIGFGRFSFIGEPEPLKRVDHLAEFKQWFESQNFLIPKNKGTRDNIKQRLEQMAAARKTKGVVEEAKAYVRTKLKRGECTQALREYLYPE